MIQIDRLPAFNDNYLWGLYEGQSAWVVDPGDAEVVQTWLTQKNLVLNGILLTHHHNDHTGGVEALGRQEPHGRGDWQQTGSERRQCAGQRR